MRALLTGTILSAALLLITRPAAGQTPETAPPEEFGQVLIIPLTGSGDGDLAEAPVRLTETLTQVVSTTGSTPVAAAVAKTDITTITGCPAESTECFQQIANTIDVDRIVFGSVEPAEEGKGIEVSLTMIERDQPVVKRRIHLEGPTLDEASTQFEPRATAFILGQPDPGPTQPAPDLTVTPPRDDQPARFAFGRVENYTWAIAGGGLLMAVTGSILLSMAADKQTEVDEAPVQTYDDLQHLADLESSGKSLNRWGNGLLIVGSLATVTGIALIFKQGLSRPDQPPALMVSPLPLEHGGGLTLTFAADL